MATRADRPYRVGDNRVPVYYAGGERIARFRGLREAAGGPEDWVASVTAFPPHLLPPGAAPAIGISRLEDGTSLAEAVRADPAGWLGAPLAEAYGEEPGLLVKLLDAGERLPVHCHPDRDFARAHLRSRFGKTEGWIVMEAAPGAAVWLGFREEVAPELLRAWVEGQDAAAMLGAMNDLTVRAGDVLYVPAGVPHAIGPGIMLTELQEPTSFSMLAEYAPFGLTPEQATLGLGWDAALACFDLRSYQGAAMARLRPAPEAIVRSDEGEIQRLFADEAAPFFQAWRARCRRRLPLGEAGFRILVVERGAGRLHAAAGAIPVAAGDTWVVPAGAGPLALEGEVELLACLPPGV